MVQSILPKEVDITSYDVVLDVRTLEEFNQGHLESAILIDIMDESFSETIEKLDKSKTYLVYCRSGRRSEMACSLMDELGFTTTNLEGGILLWSEEKLPIQN